jgi:hypothetical protein
MRLDAARTLRSFACGGRTYRFYSVAAAQALGLEGAEGLPFWLALHEAESEPIGGRLGPPRALHSGIESIKDAIRALRERNHDAAGTVRLAVPYGISSVLSIQ